MTMAIGVSGRTAFSLLMPPLIEEFHWDRGVAAGAFSLGFFVSALASPFVGRVVDARGPRPVILTGTVLVSAGLLLAPWVTTPAQLYATLGVAVGGGANMMTYTVHSQFLPNWFHRRRGFAISTAFAGAGVGAVLLLPWLQHLIQTEGWRASCVAMGSLVILVVTPITLLVRKSPADVGQRPDGDSGTEEASAAGMAATIV
ncbi:MAG: MFS transporter, partial [Proteobacteria bacterium]|nr:MFS transporter [Pseudomonadota bacterium]